MASLSTGKDGKRKGLHRVMMTAADSRSRPSRAWAYVRLAHAFRRSPVWILRCVAWNRARVALGESASRQ